MLRRAVTGAFLAAGLIALLWVQGWPLRIALVAMMVISFWEMYDAFEKRGARPVRWVGIIYALLSLPLYLLRGSAALGPLMTVACMLGLAMIILRGKVDFPSAVATLFPMLYPGMMVTLMFPMQDIPSKTLASMALALTFAVAFLTDVLAYIVGSRWGRHKLSPELSPHKSVEGAVAGLAAGVLSAILVPLIAGWITTYVPMAVPYAVDLPPLWQFALLGLIGSAASQIGDLTASMVKRYCGIKDFGNMFPGHGGMMDRMDGVLFTGVVVYVYFFMVIKL